MRIQPIRYHVQVETREIVVDFHIVDEETGVAESRICRHRVKADPSVLDILALTADVLVNADLSEVVDAAPGTLTSALHQLREVRTESAFEVQKLEGIKRAQASAETRRSEVEQEIKALEETAAKARGAQPAETPLSDDPQIR